MRPAPRPEAHHQVKALVSFEFASFQSPTPVFIDNIGDVNERASQRHRS
jgi:hypothetical protein